MQVIIDSPCDCTENAGMKDEYRIRFGTVGWQYPQWQEEYYPEELPEDWLLPFYGNEFPVVAVPASIWSADPAGQIGEWLENSDEHFRFIFEWPWKNAADLSEFCLRLKPLQTRTLGVLLQIPWSACCRQNDLASVLADISAGTPLCLEIMDENTARANTSADFTATGFRDLLASAQVNCCWHGIETSHEVFFGKRKLAVTKITNTEIEVKQLRQVLETCSAQVQSHEHMLVLFAGNPPALDKVREAMVMLELLA